MGLQPAAFVAAERQFRAPQRWAQQEAKQQAMTEESAAGHGGLSTDLLQA
ncbi:hypothetical protein PCLA_14f0065 [Pseudomonas citronellolis]|nr:hypothetical protein PCLA_14f0065 [Pseudomonas citronellolis]